MMSNSCLNHFNLNLTHDKNVQLFHSRTSKFSERFARMTMIAKEVSRTSNTSYRKKAPVKDSSYIIA